MIFFKGVGDISRISIVQKNKIDAVDQTLYRPPPPHRPHHPCIILSFGIIIEVHISKYIF